MKNSFTQFSLFIYFLLVCVTVAGQQSNGNNTDTGFQHSGKEVNETSEFRYMLYLDSLLKVKQGVSQDTISINGERNSAMKRRNNSGGNFFSNYLFSSSGVSIFFQLLAIIFILFLVYKLVLKNILFSRRVHGYSRDKSEEGDPELNDANHYHLLIRKAETNRNFNVAVKYYFLLVLKTLDEREVIQFSPDKTNENYVREITTASYQTKFASIANIYDNIWYGKFAVNDEQYQRFKNQFENFISIFN